MIIEVKTERAGKKLWGYLLHNENLIVDCGAAKKR